jgi:uncharacterized membrane protein YkoI
MPMLRPLVAALAVSLLAPALLANSGQHGREQDGVLADRKSGRVMSLREIEQRVVPRMSGYDYLGPEYDPGTQSYRLKFMRAGSVVWIDVDARTGAIIGRTGN